MTSKRGTTRSKKRLRAGAIYFYGGKHPHPFKVCSVKVWIPEEELAQEGLDLSMPMAMIHPATQFLVHPDPKVSADYWKKQTAEFQKNAKRRG